MRTADDNISMLKENNGESILPSKEFRSNYYTIAGYLNEAFVHKMKTLISRGTQHIYNHNQYKTNPIEGNYKPGRMILETSQTNELCESFNFTEIDEITKNAII